MGRFLWMAAVASSLAACAATSDAGATAAVSYRFRGSDITAVNRQATAYCQQQGKPAYLQAVRHDGSENVAVYQCGS